MLYLEVFDTDVNVILFHEQFDRSMKNLNPMIYAIYVPCVYVVLNKVAKVRYFFYFENENIF